MPMKLSGAQRFTPKLALLTYLPRKSPLSSTLQQKSCKKQSTKVELHSMIYISTSMVNPDSSSNHLPPMVKKMSPALVVAHPLSASPSDNVLPTSVRVAKGANFALPHWLPALYALYLTVISLLSSRSPQVLLLFFDYTLIREVEHL